MDKLWAEYLKAERSGVKKQWQVLLTQFIDAFVKESAEKQDAWFQINLDLFAREDQPLRHPLFEMVVYPRLMAGYERRDLNSIKLLIKLEQHLYNLKESRMGEVKLTKQLLLELALSIAPTDKELLNTKYEMRKDYLEYTLHELPAGVLYDMNGADASKCKELIEYLQEFEDVCAKLQIDETELIQECRWHYTHYPDYLSRRSEFQEYKDYIEKNCGLTAP